jgi:hypothetical protein
VIRTAQQRSAVIQKPLRRQADKTRHGQAGVAGQLQKLLPLLRRDANLNAVIESCPQATGLQTTSATHAAEVRAHNRLLYFHKM